MDNGILKAVAAKDAAVHKNPANDYQHFVNLSVFLAGIKTSSTVSAAQEAWKSATAEKRRKELVDMVAKARDKLGEQKRWRSQTISSFFQPRTATPVEPDVQVVDDAQPVEVSDDESRESSTDPPPPSGSLPVACSTAIAAHNKNCDLAEQRKKDNQRQLIAYVCAEIGVDSDALLSEDVVSHPEFMAALTSLSASGKEYFQDLATYRSAQLLCFEQIQSWIADFSSYSRALNLEECIVRCP